MVTLLYSCLVRIYPFSSFDNKWNTYLSLRRGWLETVHSLLCDAYAMACITILCIFFALLAFNNFLNLVILTSKNFASISNDIL